MAQLPLILIIILALGSLAFTLLSMTRVLHYVQAYHFEGTQYKPLFGFLPIRLLLVVYLLGSLLIAGVSISLIL